MSLSKKNKSIIPSNFLCEVMQVSRSAYYHYLEPKEQYPKEQQMEKKVVEVFRAHKRRYGIRRICAELKEEQVRIGKHKCRRILKQHGLIAIQPRSFVPRTTQSRHPYPISPNLLLNREPPRKPDEVWVGDITYLPLTGAPWSCLAVWMDLYSRRIVGWQLESHMREELVTAALKKALEARSSKAGIIIHSDRGDSMREVRFEKS